MKHSHHKLNHLQKSKVKENLNGTSKLFEGWIYVIEIFRIMNEKKVENAKVERSDFFLFRVFHEVQTNFKVKILFR